MPTYSEKIQNYMRTLDAARETVTLTFPSGVNVLDALSEQGYAPLHLKTHEIDTGESFNSPLLVPASAALYPETTPQNQTRNLLKASNLRAVGDVTQAASSILSSSVAPMLVTDAGVIEDTGTITLDMLKGAAITTGGSILSAGAAFVSHPAVIYAVAAIGALAIGWELCEVIDQKLKEINFDWGPDSTETKVVTYLVNAGGYLDTYLNADLVENLLHAFDEIGLYDEPEQTTIEPVIGQVKTYDFEGKFPSIPKHMIEPVQRLVNHFNININNVYLHVSYAADGNIWLSTFSTNRLNVVQRDARTNTTTPFTLGEQTCRIGGSEVTLKQYEITPTGEMRIVNPGQGATPFPITLYNGSSAAVVYDNFGSQFREVANNVIGPSTAEIVNRFPDETAVDLRGRTIADALPDWWDRRVGIAHPGVRDWVIDGTIPADLVITADALPVVIDYDAPGFITQEQALAHTQELVIEGHAEAGTLERVIDETGDIIVDETGEEPTPPKKPDFPVFEPPDITTPSSVVATKMLSLYNPTKAQLNSFGAALWGIDVTSAETLKRLFFNPMDAIVGLHMIYATPPTSGTGHIVAANWDSGISSALISNQYTKINCGTVKINPYYKNVHDYRDTAIQLYLPFIGIVDLDVAEVMGKTIKVEYSIDFLSGCCLAYVSISTTSGYYIAYTYPGNCAVNFPLSGASYNSTMSSILGAVAGVIGAGVAIKSGGSAAGLKAAAAGVGAMASLGGAQANIQRSGSIAGNAGAMGVKKPYVIITRNVAVDAYNRQHYEGLPQSKTTPLKNCSGYVRVKKINLDGLQCTEIEKQTILAKLTEGIFI